MSAQTTASTLPREDCREWLTAEVDEVIRHIHDRHHTYLKSELPRLAALAAQAVVEDGCLAPLQSVLVELKDELESHLWKEEVVLFPLILTLAEARRTSAPPPAAHCGSINNPIRVMRMEHSGASHALAEMRRLTNDYMPPPDASPDVREFFLALERLEADLRRHIYLEDDVLFPQASALEAGLTHY